MTTTTTQPPRVIGITNTYGGGIYTLVALCSDGSLWTTSNGFWLRVELPPVCQHPIDPPPPPPCRPRCERQPADASDRRGFHE